MTSTCSASFAGKRNRLCHDGPVLCLCRCNNGAGRKRLSPHTATATQFGRRQRRDDCRKPIRIGRLVRPSFHFYFADFSIPLVLSQRRIEQLLELPDPASWRFRIYRTCLVVVSGCLVDRGNTVGTLATQASSARSAASAEPCARSACQIDFTPDPSHRPAPHYAPLRAGESPNRESADHATCPSSASRSVAPRSCEAPSTRAPFRRHVHVPLS